ncbi:MAG: DMT family transporter [Candidatus Neomarinimicrobiota bacterium]
MPKNWSQTQIYLFLIFAMMIWGLSWTNAKILGSYASPQVLIFWRFVFSAAALYAILLGMGKPPIIPRRGIKYIVSGAILLSFYNYLYFRGTQIGPAGLGGVIVTTINPLITFLLSVIIFRTVVNKRNLAGLALGLAGGLIILKFWTFAPQQITENSNIYFLGGAFSWAIMTLITDRSKQDLTVLDFSFWVYCLSIIFSYLFARKLNLLEIFTFDWIFWLNFLLVSLGAMAFATTVYFWGAMKLGSEKAASFIFTVPVSALIFSMIFLGEPLEITTIIGGSAAIIAVYLINN